MLQNHLDMFAIVMQASMGRIVNATWMNVLLIYAQQDRYVMIILVDLHVFGKITDAKEAYRMQKWFTQSNFHSRLME